LVGFLLQQARRALHFFFLHVDHHDTRAFEQGKARGGKLVLLSDASGNARLGHQAAAVCLPTVDPIVAPILYSVPVQLLAYYAALAKGTDVNQPRNLAKSVTVE
jgi:glutamine---fructose-6-phosphate transaminase (isomerizing)